MPFDAREFRDAMGRFATGVVVISELSEGCVHAMTANAFMSGSLDPPLVVVSIALGARMHARMKGAERFGISVLVQSQQSASNHFAGRPSSDNEPEFEDLSGCPVIAGASVQLIAKPVHQYPCGDHTLFVGEVLCLRTMAELTEPLIFYSGRYRRAAALDWSVEGAPAELWLEHSFRW